MNADPKKSLYIVLERRPIRKVFQGHLNFFDSKRVLIVKLQRTFLLVHLDRMETDCNTIEGNPRKKLKGSTKEGSSQFNLLSLPVSTKHEFFNSF